MSFKETLQRRAIKNNSTKVIPEITPYDVVIKPVYTEKTYKMTNNENKYVFKVHKDANKVDVKESIKYIYGVEPKKVNLVSVPRKGRAMRSLVRRYYKKAIVTLKEWDKIELVK